MQPTSGRPDGSFGQTQWSTVLKAQAGAEETRMAALGRLLQRYRRPIILQIQNNQRCDQAQAEDLAHAFIEQWLRKDILRNVSPENGKLRTYIKACIGNFLTDVYRIGAAVKRKPGQGLQSLDDTHDGEQTLQPTAPGLSPEEQIDREWARQALTVALGKLESECIAGRRGSLFTSLKPVLGGDGSSENYASIAAALGTSESAIKIAAHRLRKRLGELIREEVAETVGTHEDLEEELRYLIELIGR